MAVIPLFGQISDDGKTRSSVTLADGSIDLSESDGTSRVDCIVKNRVWMKTIWTSSVPYTESDVQTILVRYSKSKPWVKSDIHGDNETGWDVPGTTCHAVWNNSKILTINFKDTPTSATIDPAISNSSSFVGQKASITLADGSIKAGTITSINSEGLDLMTDDGGGKILFASMSKTDQSKYGHDAFTYGLSGDEKCEKEDWEGAIADYNKAIELDPKDAFAYSGRGFARGKKGDWDAAITDYTEAIDLKPDFATFCSERGDAKGKRRDWDNVIADYNKAIELDPKAAFTYSSRGAAKGEKGDWDGAIVDYNKAVELKPEEDTFYFFRGIAKKEKGDYDGAIADYTQDIKLSPNDNEAYDNRGVAKGGLKDWDSAIADFTKAIEIAPNDDFAYSHRAKAKIEKGDVDGAAADYAKANEIVRVQPVTSGISTQSEPQPDSARGLSAGGVQIKETERSDEYVSFGWMVPVTNATNHNATNVSVEISCRDSNDIEIASFVSNDNAIPQGRTVNITASTVMKKTLWQQADHWTAKISDFSR